MHEGITVGEDAWKADKTMAPALAYVRVLGQSAGVDGAFLQLAHV